MKKHSDKRISRVSGVIRSCIIGLVTFLLLFVLMVTGVTPEQYDIRIGHQGCGGQRHHRSPA